MRPGVFFGIPCKRGDRAKNGTGHYPFGLVQRTTKSPDTKQYRFGYQGQFAELDTLTGWNHFELRQYDAVVGRWLSTDPLRQYFSPYLSMGNAPVNHTDPTGGKAFDQGINSKGDVVFDNGIDNGNVFLVDDGFTGEINDLATLKANSTQIVNNNIWVGDKMQLLDYVSSQSSIVGADFAQILVSNNFARNEPQKNQFKSRMGSFKRVDGKIIAQPLAEGNSQLTVKFIPGSKNSILGNIYNLRNTIEHEDRHQYQISKTTTFENYKAYKFFIENDAVQYQMKSKWFGKSTGSFRQAVKKYPLRWK